eukprot:gene23354-biopygen7284
MRCCRRWRNGSRDGRVGRVGREGGGGGGAVVEESAAPDGERQPDGSAALATRRNSAGARAAANAKGEWGGGGAAVCTSQPCRGSSETVAREAGTQKPGFLRGPPSQKAGHNFFSRAIPCRQQARIFFRGPPQPGSKPGFSPRPGPQAKGKH